MKRRSLTVSETDQVLTVGEAAEALNLSCSMIKKLLRQGRLHSIKSSYGWHLVTRRSIAAERRRRQRAA